MYDEPSPGGPYMPVPMGSPFFPGYYTPVCILMRKNAQLNQKTETVIARAPISTKNGGVPR